MSISEFQSQYQISNFQMVQCEMSHFDPNINSIFSLDSTYKYLGGYIELEPTTFQ